MLNIFDLNSEEDFQNVCLETFHFQYENVEVYRRFVDLLGRNVSKVAAIEQIPFLPIELFKNHQVLAKNVDPKHFFQSSGTTNLNARSKHFIADFSLYEKSIYHSFEKFIGKPEEFIFLGLLPNYSENSHSSLIYMVDFLMKKSGLPENGYFLYNHDELFQCLQKLKIEQKKVLLFGVSFALLDFIEAQPKVKKLAFENLTVIETGGMKGRKEEMTKEELLTILKKGFGTERVFSEYSMTELFSQAYSLGNNQYTTPNWMRILIRSTEDPFSYLPEHRNGAINIIDLANRNSCSFIATQDLGKFYVDSAGKRYFEVLGRIDHSDIRGCSLLVS